MFLEKLLHNAYSASMSKPHTSCQSLITSNREIKLDGVFEQAWASWRKKSSSRVYNSVVWLVTDHSQ
jgi:hypothetical protein